MQFKKAMICLSLAVLALLPATAFGGQFDSGVGMSFSIHGLPLNPELFNKELGSIVNAFNPDGLLINVDINLDLAQTSGEHSKLTAGVNLPGVFEALVGADIIINAESLAEYFAMDSSMQMESTLISHFNFEYVDHGLLAMVLTLGNQQTGTPIPDLLAELEGELSQQFGQQMDTPFVANLVKMIKDQIAKPGRIAIEYSPAQPTTALVALMEIIMAPEGGNFSMFWEQGDTELLAMIPQGLLVEGGSNSSNNQSGSDVRVSGQHPGHPDTAPVPQRPGASLGTSSGGKHTRNAF